MPSSVTTQGSPNGSLTWHDAPVGTPTSIYPPPKHDADLVRFVIISDTHNTEGEVPDGDVLLHSGDLTVMGGAEDTERAFAWLGTLPHKYKYVIAGNHDFGLCTRDNWYETRGKELHRAYKQATTDTARAHQAVRDWEAQGKERGQVHRYLEDERVEFELGGRRWSVFGSPWTPEFESWAWNYDRGTAAKDLYASLPQTDVLLTHGPPHSIGNLDHLTDEVTHVGCEELTAKLQRGDVRPLLHCCGHIHEARGIHYQKWDDPPPQRSGSGVLHNETLLVNSAIVALGDFKSKTPYHVANSPIIVDIDPSKLPAAHTASSL